MRKAQIYMIKHKKTLNIKMGGGVSSPNWGGIFRGVCVKKYHLPGGGDTLNKTCPPIY